ncbi:MAG: ParB/RepB/Spo0J family partition protein [Candidatus Moranbacteria bacterium]|nr:ParB/RepB/Spo0J family partition protein [Candidatus Moranbacteria bacterium]
MEKYGLGRGLSSLIPDDIKEDFQNSAESENDLYNNDVRKLKVKQKTSPNSQDRHVNVAVNQKTKTVKQPKKSFDQSKSQDQKKIAQGPGSSQPQKKAKQEIFASNYGQMVTEIDLDKLYPNSKQPRRSFDPNELENLGLSIKQHGLINPITIMPRGRGEYEIIAGERRFRAAEMAGLKKIPAIIREIDDSQKLELALIENLQRKDLNPIEEAMAYKKLIDDFNLSQFQVALKVNKARPSITNMLRLLKLPEEIQRGLKQGLITKGIAKTILSVEDPEEQLKFYRKIIKHDLTVSDACENLQEHVKVKPHQRKKNKIDPVILETQKALTSKIGLQVKIKPKTRGGGGKVTISYKNQQDLKKLISSLA